jgi:hypothetical protein
LRPPYHFSILVHVHCNSTTPRTFSGWLSFSYTFVPPNPDPNSTPLRLRAYMSIDSVLFIYPLTLILLLHTHTPHAPTPSPCTRPPTGVLLLHTDADLILFSYADFCIYGLASLICAHLLRAMNAISTGRCLFENRWMIMRLLWFPHRKDVDEPMMCSARLQHTFLVICDVREKNKLCFRIWERYCRMGVCMGVFGRREMVTKIRQ